MSTEPKFTALDVSEDTAEAIEDTIGMGSGAWDCVPRAEIIAAAWNHFPGPADEIARLRADRAGLLEALKGLKEEYDDRKCQWGDQYLWEKHEDVEKVERAAAAIAASEKP